MQNGKTSLRRPKLSKEKVKRLMKKKKMDVTYLKTIMRWG